MTTFGEIFYYISFVLVGIIKLAGALAFGLGIGWFALDAYKKGIQPWQTQVAFWVVLGALLIASLRFAHIFLGGVGLGLGLAVFLWGLPRKKKDQAE